MCNLPSSIPSGQSNVQYDGAEKYDYPSIGQIARALRDQDIIPIFAVTSNVRNIYEVSLLHQSFDCDILVHSIASNCSLHTSKCCHV